MVMDPLTAFGLACNIAQLVEFGLEVASKANEIASSGTTSEHKHLKTLASDALSLCTVWQDQEADKTSHGARSASSKTNNSELAGEIKNAAEEITSLLQKLDIGEQGSNGDRPAKRRRIAAQIVKGTWKKKDLDRLRARLVELQGQMTLRLISQSRDLPLKRSTSTDQKTEENIRQLAEYESLLPSLASCVERDVTLGHGIEHLTLQARAAVICRVVRDSLAFPEIKCREQSIPTPWASTFSWIFRRQDLGFAQWLSKGQGVFWITGKPGSGKSTLMKYIAQTEETDVLLREWAGNDTAIRAHHYFWYAGTAMQKSQTGLLRTLLFHIIHQFPVQAFPHIPERFRKGRSLNDFSEPWTFHELCHCIRSFGSDQFSDGKRLCFFIDGLDEYEGEHFELVDLLSTLSDCPRIKLCVASRPQNAFTRAYDQRAAGQLTIQLLTEPDIRMFVEERMANESLFSNLKLRHPEACDQLTQQIIDKAQGVFLWVRLVVNSLIRGLNNDDSLEILQRRLADYPETLDGYFQRMLDRVEKVYQMQSARILLTVLRTPRDLLFWAPRFLEVEMETPDYATMLNYRFDLELTGTRIAIRDDGSNVAYQWLQTPSMARRYLDARTGDLLEITYEPNQDPRVQDIKVQFIHRTVHDFLQHTLVHRKLLDLAGQSFDLGLSLARLYLADAKLLSRLGGSSRFGVSSRFGASSRFGVSYRNFRKHGIYSFRDITKDSNRPTLHLLNKQFEQIRSPPGTFDRKLAQHLQWG